MLVKEAYGLGCNDAFASFAVNKSAAIQVAPASMRLNPAAPHGPSTPIAHKPITTQSVNQALGAMKQPTLASYGNRLWSGLNRVAANPIGGMALSTAAMMGLGKLMEPKQPQY